MYQAIIARIKTRPHPNADRIQLADVCGTTVVVGLDQQDGDLGVYFPSDGVLSHEFCLANNLYNKSARQKLGLGDGPVGFFDHHRRVRTQGFRGQKSDGFWLPLGALEPWAPEDYSDLLIEGTMFDTLNGHQLCSKWTTRQVGVGGAPKSGRNKELLAYWTDEESARQVDALRAALGTCGNCQHAGERDHKRVWCAPPLRTDADLDTYPHSHKVMPLGERCNGWTAKEGA